MSSFGAFVSWGKRVRREGFASLGNQGQDFQAEEAALVTTAQRHGGRDKFRQPRSRMWLKQRLEQA